MPFYWLLLGFRLRMADPGFICCHDSDRRPWGIVYVTVNGRHFLFLLLCACAHIYGTIWAQSIGIAKLGPWFWMQIQAPVTRMVPDRRRNSAVHCQLYISWIQCFRMRYVLLLWTSRWKAVNADWLIKTLRGQNAHIYWFHAVRNT
jgi:hypothetical protein